MQTLGATRHQILWRLVIPANYATLFNTLRVNVGLSWVGVIMGEFLVSKAGLGYLIVYGSQVFNMDLVMATVFVLAAAAVVMVSACAVAGEGIQKTVGSDAMKRFLCGVLAVLLPAALCACGKQETATVRLSEVTHSVFYAPQYVALEQGFFADEGLKIELSNGGGATRS